MMRLLRTILAVTTLCFSMALTPAWAGAPQDLLKAQEAYRAGQINQAITLYERSLKSGNLPARDRAMICYNLGNLYLKLGGTFQERSAYRKNAYTYYGMAVIHDLSYAKAYNNRGNLYREDGALSKALADYTRAIKADPKFAPAWRNRAIVYEKKGRYPEAVADMSGYLRLTPGDKAARAKLAKLKVKIKEKQSKQPLAMQKVREGMAAMQAKKYQQAIDLFDTAIAYKVLSNYSLSRTLANRGTCWYRLGHYAKAAQSYGSAVSADPKFAGAYRDRGTAYIKMSQYSSAVANLTKAIQLDPKMANAYNNRGLAYWSLKKWPEAQRDMERYVGMAPQDKGAQTILGKIKARKPADYK